LTGFEEKGRVVEGYASRKEGGRRRAGDEGPALPGYVIIPYLPGEGRVEGRTRHWI